MIVIVSPYPTKQNERDGYLQRIRAIDSSLSKFKRGYLEISFFRNFLFSKKDISELVTVYKLNLFLHFFVILYICISARFLYVHTIINSFKVLPLYFFKKVFTDLHGVVPEEALMLGKPIKSIIHSITEFIVIRFSYRIVVVTKSMSDYLNKKYPAAKINFIYVPVYVDDLTKNDTQKKEYKEKPLLIYSGGLDSWQNVEQMLKTAEVLGDRFRFLFLVTNIHRFQELIKHFSLPEDFEFKSVSRKEIELYYQMADYGFLLRKDDPVNRVACPTKLIEYVSFGVIPVLLQPNVGDFERLGLRFVLLEDLLMNRIPSREQLESMRLDNLTMSRFMKKEYDDGIDLIKKEFLAVK